MKIFLATWLEDDQGKTLSKVGYQNRLLSYSFLRGCGMSVLREYIEAGFVLKRKEVKGETKNK